MSKTHDYEVNDYKKTDRMIKWFIHGIGFCIGFYMVVLRHVNIVKLFNQDYRIET